MVRKSAWLLSVSFSTTLSGGIFLKIWLDKKLAAAPVSIKAEALLLPKVTISRKRRKCILNWLLVLLDSCSQTDSWFDLYSINWFYWSYYFLFLFTGTQWIPQFIHQPFNYSKFWFRWRSRSTHCRFIWPNLRQWWHTLFGLCAVCCPLWFTNVCRGFQFCGLGFLCHCGW